MALSWAQKSDTRRHLMFPVAGLLRTSGAGGTLATGAIGYRWLQAYGFLEYRMNNLNPDEEARLTGKAYSSLAFFGPQPNEGDTVTVTLSGGNIATPQTLTAVAPAPSGNDNRITLVNLLASAAGQNGVLQAAEVEGLSPYGTGSYSLMSVPFPEIAFTSPVPFTMQATGSGITYPQITANGVFLSPSASLDGVTVTWGYLPILNGLESAFGGASQNLDTLEASVWVGRLNEIGQRWSLYKHWQVMLSEFLGIPINPDRKNKNANIGAMRYS